MTSIIASLTTDVEVEKCLIDGQWVTATTGRTFDVYNKSTGQLLARVPDLNDQDAKIAVDAAANALQGTWSTLSVKSRSAILQKIALLLRKEKQHLAEIITLEHGKPLKDAKNEIEFSAEYFEWFAASTLQLSGQVAPSMVPNVTNVVVKIPVGVCALITPWNFPAMMLARKLAPALGAGCTAVIKAPVECPLTTLALCRLIENIEGVEAGVINVITTSKENENAVGRELCENDLVRKLSFTGSSRVGKLLTQQSANTLKKLTMELGGNAPFIVFADANLPEAIQSAIAAKFRNNGQSCICANRFFIHKDIYQEFVDGFAMKVKDLKIGDGFKDNVDLGPMISQVSVEKAARHVEDCLARGAQLVCGGKQVSNSLFFEPTVLSNVKRGSPMDYEETFGPVAAIYSFETEEEVIEAANDTPYGLAAYLFSRDMDTCLRVASAIDTGMIGINSVTLSQVSNPFGGNHDSGFGREGSVNGLGEYMVDKLMVMRHPNSKASKL